MMRRSSDQFAATCDRCARCGRTLLAGEQVYDCGRGRLVCELCIAFESDPPRASRLVHGPEWGHTIHIKDQRSVS
jgi:recombinational DNA repair protein (RecF pathway)